MSKMGQELEKRLDENKYEMYGACQAVVAARDYLEFNQAELLVEQVLAKIEGK